MEYTIRWAKGEDAGELGYVHCKTWQAAYKNIIPDSILEKMSPDKRAQYFVQSIDNKTEETAVLLCDKKVVGFITLGKCRDLDQGEFCGEIWGIYILPSYWRKGLGSALLNWGIRELKDRGYQKISLWVLEQNNNARNFYEKQGFAFDGTIEEINLGRQLKKVRYCKDNI